MFEINPFEIWHGDCFLLMHQIPDKSVDCIIADMPYGQTKNKWDVRIPLEDYVLLPGKDVPMTKDEFLLYCFHTGLYSCADAVAWFKKNSLPGLWTHYKRIIKDNGAIILFAKGMFTADLMDSNRSMWRYNLIWEKSHPSGFLNANKMPLRGHEDICVFYKKLPVFHPQKTDGHKRKVSLAKHQKNRDSSNYNNIGKNNYDSTERFPRSIWRFAKDTQKEALHPTQKPVALMEELIKTYTDPGDIVFDPFAGVMTTGTAAVRTGRKTICIEKKQFYFDRGAYRVLKEYVTGKQNDSTGGQNGKKIDRTKSQNFA